MNSVGNGMNETVAFIISWYFSHTHTRAHEGKTESERDAHIEGL